MPFAIRTMGPGDHRLAEALRRAHLDAAKQSDGVLRMVKMAIANVGHDFDKLPYCACGR